MRVPSDVVFAWRGPFENAAVNQLHADGFALPVFNIDWSGRVADHSLGWVCAHQVDRLVGFVNVGWDGGVHAFVLDTLVDAAFRRTGVGTELIRIAVGEARAAGCTWLHVDFEPQLHGFYIDACGFRVTDAGLLQL